jgi:hypothetical protein
VEWLKVKALSSNPSTAKTNIQTTLFRQSPTMQGWSCLVDQQDRIERGQQAHSGHALDFGQRPSKMARRDIITFIFAWNFSVFKAFPVYCDFSCSLSHLSSQAP